MAEDLESQKKARKVYRGSFTKTANEFAGLLVLDRSEQNDAAVGVCWETLKPKYDSKVRDSAIFEGLLANATEEELSTELDSCDAYNKRFVELRLKYENIYEDTSSEVAATARSQVSGVQVASAENHQGKRKFKLPRIELKPYDGSIQGWLSFWGQFQKIHDDPDIDNPDKIQYLVQATVPGSRARQLVESFPSIGDNYGKIVDSMSSSFGNKDMQIEVYIRELLKLILGSATSTQKIDIATFYDKIETQLRALETLGVTTGSCSAMLFPLIESCLPPDLLRVWQRSSFSVSSAPTSPDVSVLELRLKGLMSFLSNKVEHEQRITLAAEGFGFTERVSCVSLGSNEESFKKRRPARNDPIVLTATGLMICEVAKCIFCDGLHESSACFKANKMSMEEKRDILSSKKACFRSRFRSPVAKMQRAH